MDSVAGTLGAETLDFQTSAPGPSGVGVLDKAIGIVAAIADRGPLLLADLQSATGVPRATAHRLAVALEQHDVLRRDEAGRFCLGLALIGLGNAALDTFPIARVARPRLQRLGDETGESVQLYVRDGTFRRCAVSLPSPHGLRWIVAEGTRLPLHLGSAGRVLSGEESTTGWVETVEEREAGVASVSAPIAAAGEVFAAVSVGGPIGRMGASPGERFGDAVVRAAGDIQRDL